MSGLLEFLTGDSLFSMLTLLFIKSATLAVLGLVCWRLFRRAAASTRHAVLGASLVAIILLPAIAYLSPGLALRVAATQDIATHAAESAIVVPPNAQVAVSASAQPVSQRVTEARPVRRVAAGDVMLLVYLSGAVATLLYLMLGLAHIGLISRRSTEICECEVWERTAGAVAANCKPGRRTQIRLSRQIASPMTWGVITPVVLMPEASREWSETDRRNALLHELAHVDRGDWLTRVLARVACAVHWFNPLIWIAARLMNAEAELAADDRVLASGSHPDDYAEQLVALTQVANFSGALPTAAAAMANASLLKRRVTAILNRGENRMPMNQFARYALLANIALIALFVGSTQPVAAGSDDERYGFFGTLKENETTPLHRAAADGDYAEAARLIEGGADINETLHNSFGPYQRTVLGTAARGGHLDVAGLLLDAGADVNRVKRGDGTALIEAIRARHLDMARYLIDRGADVNLVVRGDGSPLIAATRTRNIDAVRLLLSHGADADEWVRGDENPLYHAANSGNVEILRLLIDAGVDVNRKMRGDGNALIVATRGGHDDAANLLIDAGARGDVGVKGDGNALIAAARDGNLDLLRRMIAAGANVNAAVVRDGSPLIVASRNRQIDAARLLVDHGADVNQFVMGDETALIGAAWRGDVEMVEFLLSVGADPTFQARTPEGETRSALRQATLAGHTQVAGILRAAGARE